MPILVVSGTVRLTNTSVIIAKTFSAAITVSQFLVQDINLANGVSDYVVSLATVSVPTFFMLLGDTSAVRVNPGLHIASGLVASGYSVASVGISFKNLFAQIGSGQSGPLAIHMANSSGDSATITCLIGM